MWDVGGASPGMLMEYGVGWALVLHTGSMSVSTGT